MNIIKQICISLLTATALLGLTMCSEPADAPTGEALTAIEQDALSTEFTIDAEQQIAESNAMDEADKLAAEIEADLAPSPAQK